MTDVLDRLVVDEALAPVAQPGKRQTRLGLDPETLRVAACVSIAAGVIHLVMVPSHAGESMAEGVGFALAGWFQLLTAWFVLIRPARRLLAPIALANATFIAVWILSRTAGMPIGQHAGHAETAGFVDLTAVGLEVVLLVACVLLGLRAGIGRVVCAIVMIGAFAMATAAMASPSARDHAAHSHGDTTNVSAGATHDHATPAVDDKGLSALSNGHHHVIGPEQPLDVTTRAELTRQISLTQQVAVQYPTVAAAEAAGYRRAGPYSPGLGAHYIRPSGEGLNPDGVMADADLLNPLAIIYAGTAPDSAIAGFMYYSMSPAEPSGFAGPNDHWHYHTNTCLTYSASGEIDAPFGADSDVPAELCTRAGGILLEQTQWMVHVWSVPGWESQQGLFGEVNPALSCADGTYFVRPLEEWIDHPLNVCTT